MKKITSVILIGLMFAGCSTFTTRQQPKNYPVSEIISVLASDEFEGRRPGTEGMDKASAYVENYLNEIGIEPYFDNSYRDSVVVRERSSYNIVGKIPAGNATDEYILISAHLDHLGTTTSGTDTIYNGANDNASGVTAVLKIADNLKDQDLSKNVIVTIFTEEESGLNGARHLAARLNSDNVNLEYVINFEMIGKPLSDDSATVYITGHNMSNLAEVTNELLGEEFIKLEPTLEAMGLFRAADNYPFFQEFNIPSHTLSTFDFENYPYYHHVDDEFEYLDTAHMEYIIGKSSEMIIQLLENDAEITLND